MCVATLYILARNATKSHVAIYANTIIHSLVHSSIPMGYKMWRHWFSTLTVYVVYISGVIVLYSTAQTRATQSILVLFVRVLYYGRLV